MKGSGMEPIPLCMQGAKNLACAVIERAIRDYAAWYALYLRDPSYRTAVSQCEALEDFFTSAQFDLYATLAESELRGEEVAAGVRIDVRRREALRRGRPWTPSWRTGENDDHWRKGAI